MRVAIVIPPGLPVTAGNHVSARRLAAWLGRLGAEARVLEADPMLAAARGCGVIHAFHALQAGEAARIMARRTGLPLVVTLTGTDLSQGDTAALREVAGGATVMIAYHAEAKDTLLRRLPGLTTPVQVIAPGVETPAPGPRRRALWGWARGEIVFLLPSGIRRVKDPGFAVGSLAVLRARGLPVRLAVAGAVREAAAGTALEEAMTGLPWASYLGEVPHEGVGELYRAADVIINTSRSEGLSNAVLEAMAAGRPVLASDIAGNRAAIRHSEDGILYRDRADFLRWAELLATSPRLRARLGGSARRTAALRFSPVAEAQAHIRLYRMAAGAG
jgi:glycosyltransferase involved in cell wall biosynthesis